MASSDHRFFPLTSMQQKHVPLQAPNVEVDFRRTGSRQNSPRKALGNTRYELTVFERVYKNGGQVALTGVKELASNVWRVPDASRRSRKNICTLVWTSYIGAAPTLSGLNLMYGLVFSQNVSLGLNCKNNNNNDKRHISFCNGVQSLLLSANRTGRN